MKDIKLSERDLAFMDCIYLPDTSWVARDNDGRLNLHLCKDEQGIAIYNNEVHNTLFWAPKSDGESINLNEGLFQFITFDKPQKAEDLEKMYYEQIEQEILQYAAYKKIISETKKTTNKTTHKNRQKEEEAEI